MLTNPDVSEDFNSTVPDDGMSTAPWSSPVICTDGDGTVKVPVARFPGSSNVTKRSGCADEAVGGATLKVGPEHLVMFEEQILPPTTKRCPESPRAGGAVTDTEPICEQVVDDTLAPKLNAQSPPQPWTSVITANGIR